MSGVTVTGKDRAGGIILPTQSMFQVGGNPVAVVGCPVVPHGKSPHNAPKMVEGVGWFTVNGIPVCHAGNKASCGHSASGQGWFNIG